MAFSMQPFSDSRRSAIFNTVLPVLSLTSIPVSQMWTKVWRGTAWKGSRGQAWNRHTSFPLTLYRLELIKITILNCRLESGGWEEIGKHSPWLGSQFPALILQKGRGGVIKLCGQPTFIVKWVFCQYLWTWIKVKYNVSIVVSFYLNNFSSFYSYKQIATILYIWSTFMWLLSWK